jgi:hypothetical protein
MGLWVHGLYPESQVAGWLKELRLAQSQPPLAKDFEASIASAKAWVYIASLPLLARRLVRLLHKIYIA